MKYFMLIGAYLAVSLSFSHAVAQNKVVVVPLNLAKKIDNVVTVSTKGGDFSDPVAAVNSIADATESNPYIVLVGPGVYALTQTLVMKPYVSIAGSGQEATFLRCAINPANPVAGSSVVTGTDNAILNDVTSNNVSAKDLPHPLLTEPPPPIDSSVVVGANTTTLSDLTIENNGGKEHSFAIYNLNSSPTIHDVTAISYGGNNNCAVYNIHSSPSMTNVIATATGGMFNKGVSNEDSSPTMNNVTATGSGGTINHGVANSNSSPTMNNVTATATSGFELNNIVNIGVGIYSDNSSPSMTNVTATASGGKMSYGVDIGGGSFPSMNNVTAIASGATLSNYGVKNFEASPTIRHCTLSGSGNGIYHEGGTTRVMQSSIIGGAINISGTLTCVTSDNGVTTALNIDCQ